MKKMKKYLLMLTFFLIINIPLKSQLFEGIKSLKELSKDPFKGNFTEKEAAEAIKSALSNGIGKGTDVLSKTDGFLKNPEVKLPFPQDAKNVESALRKAGLGKQVDDVIFSINRAAEDATSTSKDIFIGAVKKMTITDAINIVKGNENSATQFLQNNTSNELKTEFKPIIQKSLDKVNATKYWETAINTYNKIPFMKKLNPNLNDYVTEKTMVALFLMISKEEIAIRKDPAARTTDLLKKVFGK